MLKAYIAEKLHFGRDDELTLNRVLPRPIHPYTIKKVQFTPETSKLTVFTQQKKFTFTLNPFIEDVQLSNSQGFVDEHFVESEIYKELRYLALNEDLTSLDRDILKQTVKSVNNKIRQSLDVYEESKPAYDSEHDVDPNIREEDSVEESNIPGFWRTMEDLQDELEGSNAWGEPYYY
eukprot:5841972-Pleurochrysis_carterae.AAC.1